ncbi:SapC family protein [Seleniivibrio sp.]|uniref:SapC family protein n=1 Tax=Seleniivibrio sp. TaxID=2898801 RepID=UPI0025F1D9FF|nr:SapC family protein [Seleniivibrio sp.]MCD8552534.1 SapC family protein [Seleniivibrio sp.]
MYQKVTVINKTEHANLKFMQLKDLDHAVKAANVPLTIGEFYAACKSQPILFVKSGENMLPTALLGIKNEENLFINAEKNWMPTEYCPFFIKRYPFIFVNVQDRLTLAYDTDSLSANMETGEAIFDENGEQTDFIKKILDLMNKYQADSEASAAFGREIVELDLFEPFEITMNVGPNKYQINDFHIISEKKFNEMPMEKKTMLIEKGFYSLVLAHLLSLSNMDKLAVLESMRLAGAKNA